MDGVHDLGGLGGFGPVRWSPDHGYEPFYEDWHAHAAAMCIAMFSAWRTDQSGCSLDWFRHVRECIDPVDYLTRPYFDQWAQTMMAILIDHGSLDFDDLIPNGAADDQSPKAKTIGKVEASTRNRGESAPAFAAGDRVRAKMSTGASHTRLPIYARGRVGVIEEHHGLQLFADANAGGDARREHLYTVGFMAADLWPEVTNKDRLFIDLWESHFEPA